jgi:L-fuculose-phosphate aldolase
MWERDLIAGSEGNLSARLGEGHVLLTPAGRNKGRLESNDLVIVDLMGRIVDGDARPSSEIQIHLAAYRLRADVGAVIHAHPCALVAHSLAGVALAPAFNPEVFRAIGPIAEVAHEAAGSEALAARFEGVLADHNAFIMARHGAVTLGNDIEHAFDRLEMLEQLARMQVMAQVIAQRAIG